MAAIPRVGSKLGRLLIRPSQPSNYVCVNCRRRGALPHHKIATISTSVLRKARDTSFTGKVRRRLWGTDNPPGSEDPYTQRPGPDTFEDAAALTGTGDAKTIDQVGYEPATTWDGLESIGGSSGWWEEAWDKEHHFTGFMSSTIKDSREDVAKSIRRALIEIYTLNEAGRPLTDAVYTLDDKIIPSLGGVSFSTSADGSVKVLFPDEETRQAVLQSTVESKSVEQVLEIDEEVVAEVGVEGEESTTTADLKTVSARRLEGPPPQTIEAFEPVADDSWITIAFPSADLKFAIFKRVMQLTGRRIPDPEISQIYSARELLLHLTKKPKPKKLAEALLKREDLLEIPNLQIRDRRFTPIDEEKEVGRWKVIEKELEKRGLPVTGQL